jgi:hypothetical protein
MRFAILAHSPVTEIDLRPFRNGPTRAALRKRLMLNFANETPGLGKKEKASRYRYIVETLNDGNVIAMKSGIESCCTLSI